MATNSETAKQIAVVGLACRLPGDVYSPKEFWEMLLAGRSGLSSTSKRFNPDGFHHPLRNKRNTVPTKEAHYLSHDIGAFDAAFFNITQVEAMALDPQQRLALEVAYEAFENSGMPIDCLSGSQTSCYVGAATAEWNTMQVRDADFAPLYLGTGAGPEFLSNRISWFFNLKGPSITVNTACSSSLVALHLAQQSILTGESTMAVVGGVNLLLTPEPFMFLGNQNFLAQDGRSKSFDASGDGYGRGEGCGMVILKRLDHAIRDGDAVRAIVRGSGVNSDGLTQGITMPNADAQSSLIRSVYLAAGLELGDTQYVEAHGTGTKAGDPIELRAIASTLGSAAKGKQNLLVGSVKPNIGHLEAAAGVSGVIKGVLSLEKGLIPPNILFNNPNPDIPFDAWNIRVPVTTTNWPSSTIRRMSVNSFGVGGTNAHVVLESAGKYAKPPTFKTHNGLSRVGKAPLRLFLFSAHDQAGLVRVKKLLAGHLKSVHQDPQYLESADRYLADLAHTLGSRRSKLAWKTFHIALGLEKLQACLDVPEGELALRSHGEPRIGLIFTGQGAQWARMGVDLCQYKEFEANIRDAGEILLDFGCPWSVWEQLHLPEEESNINRPEYSQPLCTILQIALLDLLVLWGVRYNKVVGHSSGEIAAAYSIGAISKREALKVAYFRGTASAMLRSAAPDLDGGMMAAGCSVVVAQSHIAKVTRGKLIVACVNSPSSVTVSGDVSGLEQLQPMLEKENISVRRLKVENAYHSHHMHVVSAQYLKSISGLRTMKQSSSLPVASSERSHQKYPIMVSSVQAAEVDPSGLDASYWARNMVAPVLFSDALIALVAPLQPDGRVSSSSVDLLIEVGPHSALAGPVRQILKEHHIEDVAYESVLTRGKNAADSALHLAGSLFSRGCPIQIDKVNGDGDSRHLTDLPPYPWNHSRRFWPESRLYREYCTRSYPRMSLIGAPAPSVGENERLWRGCIRLSEEPWIRDHVIQSSVIFPGAGYIVMAIEAARQVADPGRIVRAIKMRDIEISVATVMSEGVDVETVVHFRPHLLGTRDTAPAAWWEFSISTCGSEQQNLQQNCSGLLYIDYFSDTDHMNFERRYDLNVTIAEHHRRAELFTDTVEADQFYKELRSIGLNFGDKFRNVSKLQLGDGSSCCEITVSDPGETFSSGQMERPYLIHPTTLDSMFHTVVAALFLSPGRAPRTMVPKSIDELEISMDISATAGTRFRGTSSAKWHGFRDIVADIQMLDESATSLALSIKGYRSTEVSDGQDDRTGPSKDRHTNLCAKNVWKPAIDLMTTQDLEKALISSTSASERALQIIGMLLHSDPNAAVLEFWNSGSDESSLIRTMLNDSKTTQLNYTAVVPLSEMKKPGSGINSALEGIKIMAVDKSSIQDSGVPNFDLLLISEISTFGNMDDILDEILSLANIGGKVLFRCSKEITEVVRKILMHNHFCIHHEIAVDDGIVLISSLVSQNMTGIHHDDPGVLIIEPRSMSDAGRHYVTQLQLELESCGRTTTSLTWGAENLDALVGQECICLVELETCVLDNLSKEDFEILKQVILKPLRLLWITAVDSPASVLMDGMARTIRNEIPQCRIQTLHLSPQTFQLGRPQLVLRVLASSSAETEFIEENGVLLVSRVLPDAEMDANIQSHLHEEVRVVPIEQSAIPLRLTISKPGLLSTLYFEPDDRMSTPLGSHEVEIKVMASGMNFRDIMSAMGLLPDSLLGCEGSGIVAHIGSDVTGVKVGDRVVAMTFGAHATHIRTVDQLCEVIPNNISFAEAAAIAVVHCTAYHALFNLTHLQPGQSVLIHAAAGGVGQAAIQLAHHLKLTIYATVGSPEKRALLRERYAIPDEHIFYSRDASFALAVRRVTAGRGVDCVLNSLAGELLRQSWYCLAPFGTFVEIGMRDVVSNMRLDMRPFESQTTFTFFNLLETMKKAPELMESVFRGTFELLRQGVIAAPTPVTTYSLQSHQDAFRLIQAGKHLGKVVLSYEGGNEVPVLHRPQDSLIVDPAATYLLVGGLGGLGRSLARLLVDSGARHIAFFSRSGAKSSQAKDVVEELTKRSCIVKVYQVDVSDNGSLQCGLQLCQKDLPPVRGVVQLAMVLQDVIFENMMHEQWTTCTRPKVQGTWNLHEAFQHELDFFVILSSCAGIFGNRGQANYAAAGAFQDAVAKYRHGRGLKAVSIDLGIMLGIGVLAETGVKGDVKTWEEVLGINESEFHALMRSTINGQRGTGALAFPSQIITGLGTGSQFDDAKIPRPDHFSDPRFSGLAMSSSGNSRNTGLNEKETSMRAELNMAGSLELAAEIITRALVGKVSEILQSPASEIDPARPLYTYGIDSLVAMEVRNWLVRDLQADVALFEVLAAIPIHQFAARVAEKSKLVSVHAAAGG